MNEFNEMPKEFLEKPALPEVQEIKAEFDEVKDVWDDYVFAMVEFSDTETEGYEREVVEAREYGVKECAEVAKECFTVEVIREWGSMSLEERDRIIQEYAQGIGTAMDINFKGIVWEEFPIGDDGSYTYGYNSGDGYVHLNVDILCDPAQLMQVIDTVAHEARHQMQSEAIENPSKFPIDEATIREWTVAKANYTLEMPTAYDPWGYTYNPMELDSKFFGESMVRELTKDIINNA